MPTALVFKDLNGRDLALGDAIAGRPTLLLPADFTCSQICGPALSIAASALSQTGLQAGRDYSLVVVGIDANDGIGAARRFVSGQVGGPGVSVLSGDGKAIHGRCRKRSVIASNATPQTMPSPIRLGSSRSRRTAGFARVVESGAATGRFRLALIEAGGRQDRRTGRPARAAVLRVRRGSRDLYAAESNAASDRRGIDSRHPRSGARFAVLAIWQAGGLAMNQIFTLPEATTHAVRVDQIFYGLLVLSGLTLLLVFSLVLVLAIRYRRGSAAKRGPLPEIVSREFEIGWTTATLFLFAFLFWWAASADLSSLSAPANALEMHVVAKQWMWKTQHPNGAREINALHIPVDKPVRLVMTSQDVIHSFFVPAFRVKQDVVPGRETEIWFRATKTGVFPLLCAEYCGTDHSMMRGRIMVMRQEDYADWLSQTAGRRRSCP